jgi:signal transduction histidine kinase
MAEASPPCILVVDDDPALLDALSEALALRLEGMVVETCEGANEALSRIAAREYDVVISDIKMPGIDGLELLDRIRQVSSELPTLLITGHGETDLAIKALRAGAYDLIQKPLDRDYLVASVTRAIELRRLKREVALSQQALRAHAQELELKVEERTAELREVNRRKDELLALVSHELRTPTTTIYGATRLLMSRAGTLAPEDEREIISSIASEADRLRNLIEDLLALGRSELNIAVPLSRVDLQEVISATVRSFAKFAPARKIEVELGPGAQFVVAEVSYVQQVLQNLLSNANKYSPANTPILVTVSPEDSEVHISVSDEGPGVAEDELAYIFDSFFRSQTAKGMAQGKGLGLTVCKRLVEAQGGRIWASNRSAGGLEVIFTLRSVIEDAELMATV